MSFSLSRVEHENVVSFFLNKNAVEVDIAPASGKIQCNSKHEIKVKGTRSMCALKGHVKDNYYARFHIRSYLRCRENQTLMYKIIKSMDREM